MAVIGFLGAFVKFRTASISFVMSVCSTRLSVRVKQFGSHWTDFHEIWYLSMFPEYVAKIKVSLKPDKKNGYFT
jgi:hypothetical protein